MFAGSTYPDLIDETYFLDENDRDFSQSNRDESVTSLNRDFSSLDREKKSITFPDDKSDGESHDDEKVNI